MRLVLFAAAILQSVSFLAQPSIGAEIVSDATQPIVSDEVVSDPLPPHVANVSIAAPAVAMARDSRGVVIAWSMPNRDGFERVYAARLDTTAHVSGAIHELPALPGSNMDALNPSLAANPDGKGFVVAFLQSQRYSTTWTAAYEQLDSDLNPATPVALSTNVNSPVLARAGASTWITVDGNLWRIRTDGSAEPQRLTLPMAADMVVIGADIRSVGTHTVQPPGFARCDAHCPNSNRWYCPPTCQLPFPPISDLEFTQLNSGSDPVSLPFPGNLVVNNPAVHGDGRILFLAWFEGKPGKGGSVRGARILEPAPIWPFTILGSLSFVLGPFAPGTGPTTTSIATDGRRFVVVWRTATSGLNHDVRGAIVDEDGSVAELQIASSSADELDPSVIAVRPGQFLVAYEKDFLGERRIAGKLLTFPVRRRAIR